MRISACLVALAACLVFTASAAESSPHHRKVAKAKTVKKAKQVKKVTKAKSSRAKVFRAEDDGDEDVAEARDTGDDTDDDEADEGGDERADEAETAVKLTAAAPRRHDWHVAIGPYLWASSVDANVSLGPTSVASGVDFMTLQRHAKYGAELLGEVRYRGISLAADFLYGVVGVTGETEVGPLMVTLDGEASSLLTDGVAGYQLVGTDHSLFSFEPRAGVRYQRTAISANVGVAGNMVAPPASVDAATDAIAGARVSLRPWQRFSVSGNFDIGVVGTSTSTWSASADASLRITSHVMLSLGWRTLTTERPHVSVVMHGPRAALQLLF